MGVDGVVILHPMINASQRGSGIGYWTDPDIVALKGFHKSLGHAVAFRAFDRGETRSEVERQGNLDGLVSSEDRAVVGEPLHRMRSANCAKALLDALNHHIADHLAGDAGGRRHPGDGFAVMAIEGEGNAHHLAVPTREFQRVRAPAAIRADRRDLAVIARALAGVRYGVRAAAHASSSAGRRAWHSPGPDLRIAARALIARRSSGTHRLAARRQSGGSHWRARHRRGVLADRAVLVSRHGAR